MNEKFVDEGYGKRVLGCYLLGLPLAAAGLLLCATIVFSPVGLLALIASGIPLYKVQKKHMEKRLAWQNRDRLMPNEAVRPWLMSTHTETSYVLDSLIDRVEPDA